MEKPDTTLKEEVVFFLQKVKRHFVIAALIFFLPIAIALFFAYRDFPTYNTRMMMRMTILSNQEMIYFFKSLQDLLAAHDYQTISGKYFIEKKYADDIRTISVEKVKDKSDVYIVNLSCRDVNCIIPIEKGLSAFMIKTSDANEKNKFRKLALTSQIDSVESQIKIMQELVTSIRSNKSISTDIYPFYAASATTSLLQLYDKRNDLNEKLNTTNGFSIVDSFVVPGNPQKLSLTKYIIVGLIAGMMISYFVVKELLNS